LSFSKGQDSVNLSFQEGHMDELVLEEVVADAHAQPLPELTQA